MYFLLFSELLTTEPSFWSSWIAFGMPLLNIKDILRVVAKLCDIYKESQGQKTIWWWNMHMKKSNKENRLFYKKWN